MTDSRPPAVNDDLRDMLVAISKAVADQDDRAAQAMLREILKAPQLPFTAQAAESVPAVGYPPLPTRRRAFLCTKCGGRECEPGTIGESHPPCKCGYLGFAEDLDFTADDMRAYVNADRAARAPADSVTAPAAGAVAGPVDDIDAMALDRYKVVPSHDSMFHRFAVVAGDGQQQLYVGRETECQNMARKFAGAFLDGAYYQSHIAAAPTPAAQADTVLEDAARLDFIEKHPDMRFRHRKGKWAFGGFTNYEYEMLPSLREAIDAARKQGANHD